MRQLKKNEQEDETMSLIMQRANNILKKLKETNYDMFDGDKEEAIEFVSDNLEAFPKYANVVIREQIMMPIWSARYEGQEFRDKVQDIDASRRYAHEGAITACNVLNRLSKNLGLETFADIDTSDRHAVAEFVGRAVNELYNDGIGNSDGHAFDAATYNKMKEYETQKMHEEMAKLDKNNAAIEQNQRENSVFEK